MEISRLKTNRITNPLGSSDYDGQGADGIKASGMLMVDGVLYMFTRNAGNSKLAWSHDHGKTWKWP